MDIESSKIISQFSDTPRGWDHSSLNTTRWIAHGPPPTGPSTARAPGASMLTCSTRSSSPLRSVFVRLSFYSLLFAIFAMYLFIVAIKITIVFSGSDQIWSQMRRPHPVDWSFLKGTLWILIIFFYLGSWLDVVSRRQSWIINWSGQGEAGVH